MATPCESKSKVCPTSRITGGPTAFVFETQVLGKYQVSYYRCEQTGFIQCEDPYWLPEAYSDAIADLDIGLAKRNLEKAAFTERFIDRWMAQAGRFADFGGGYGLFTRLMRDRGYSFRHFDPKCVNLFAKGFELNSLHGETLDLVTAWEVFEHLSHPQETLDQHLKSVDSFLFSTVLIPQTEIRDASDWWYFMPETGQHVSFYTTAALSHLADEFRWHYYSDGVSLHLFTKRQLPQNPFRITFMQRLARRFKQPSMAYPLDEGRRKSLTETDFLEARNRMQANPHPLRPE